MYLYRLVVPVLAVFIALAGATNLAFASGHPVDGALPADAGPAQDSDADAEATDAASDEDGDIEGDGASDVRPDRDRSKQRLAAICYRLLESDREAPNLRARCAEIFGDHAPDPGAVCRRLAENGADEHAIARCRDHFGEDGAPDPRILRQRLHDGVDQVRERLPDDVDREQVRARLHEQLQNADGPAAERIRTQLAQRDGAAGDQLRRRIGQHADSPFRVRPDEALPVRAQ